MMERRNWLITVIICIISGVVLCQYFLFSPSLHHATKNGNMNALKKIIATGADLNAKDKKSKTPLYYAARYGRTDIARLLIENGVDIEAKAWVHDDTPLHTASYFGQQGMVELLLNKGANVNSRNRYGNTPLCKVWSGWHKDTAIAEILISYGANVNTKGNTTPLHRAVEHSKIDLVKLLIAKGADVNSFARLNWTPLDQANREFHENTRPEVKKICQDIINILKESGAKSKR